MVATELQLRSGTTAQHAAFTGAANEITSNTTTKTIHVHDGTTLGGFPLARTDLTNISDTTFINRLSSIGFGGGGGGGGGGTSSQYDTPEAHGCIGDGITDDTISYNAFLQSVQGTNKIGKHNGLYRITNTLSPVTESITLEGPGGLYYDIDGTASFNPFIIRFNNLQTIVPASISNNTTYQFSTSTSVTPCAAISLPTGHTVSSRSMWLLYSDDSNPFAAGEGLLGEPIFIVEVSGNIAYTSAPLRYSYATNIRMAEYDVQKKLSIDGMTFTNNWTKVIAGALYTQLLVQGTVATMINNCSFSNTSYSGLRLGGNVAPRITNSSFIYGRNRVTTAGITGYGIVDQSYHSLISNNYFQDVRHGYTTDVVAVPSAWYEWGVSQGSLVTDSIAFGCSAAGFDTHPGSDLVIFSNCVATGSYSGESSTSLGFQLRGTNHTIDNCRANNVLTGILIKSEYANNAKNHVVRNFDYNGAGRVIQITNSLITQTPEIKIIGGVWATSYVEFVNIPNPTKVNMRGVEMRQFSTTTAPRAITLGSEVNLEISNCRWDMSENTNTSGRYIHVGGTNNVIVGHSLTTKTAGNAWQAWVGATNQNVSVHIEGDANSAPTTANGLYQIGGTDLSSSLTVNRARTTISGILSRTSADTTLSAGNESGDALLVYTVTSATTVTGAASGVKVGQKWYVFNSSSSSNSVTINHNPGSRLTLGSAVTLAPGTGLSLIWDGTTLRLASASITSSGGISGINLKEDSVTKLSSATDITFTGTDFNVSNVGVISLPAEIVRNTVTTDVNFSGFKASNAILGGYTLGNTPLTFSSPGTLTINYANNNVQKVTVSSNITGLTINGASTTNVCELVIALSFATGAGIVSFGSTVDWGSDGAPTSYSTGVSIGTVDLIQLVRFPGAAKWIATSQIGFSSAVV